MTNIRLQYTDFFGSLILTMKMILEPCSYNVAELKKSSVGGLLFL
jgi:hypothetical protein